MIDLSICKELVGKTVPRPNITGTLSGHAAGEPFEKLVYNELKKHYPNEIHKQFEFLNDLYLKNPKSVTIEQRNALIQSPTALFLLSRGDSATAKWNPMNVFEEKQNDTADILYHRGHYFGMIDVKTRNCNKNAQPPNIISAYKLAKACAYIIDNEETTSDLGIFYIGVDWKEENRTLKCTEVYIVDLFKADPKQLYINWAAAMQIQFQVHGLDQTFKGTLQTWCKEYLRVFVNSAKHRCEKMLEMYVRPFEKYL